MSRPKDEMVTEVLTYERFILIKVAEYLIAKGLPPITANLMAKDIVGLMEMS